MTEYATAVARIVFYRPMQAVLHKPMYSCEHMTQVHLFHNHAGVLSGNSVKGKSVGEEEGDQEERQGSGGGGGGEYSHSVSIQ